METCFAPTLRPREAGRGSGAGSVCLAHLQVVQGGAVLRPPRRWPLGSSQRPLTQTVSFCGSSDLAVHGPFRDAPVNNKKEHSSLAGWLYAECNSLCLPARWLRQGAWGPARACVLRRSLERTAVHVRWGALRWPQEPKESGQTLG